MAEQQHSAKSWAAASFNLIDVLIDQLKESGVLTAAEVEKIRASAISRLKVDSDSDSRRGAEILESIYFQPRPK